jgi:peptidyl-dipeptidase Dcp
MNPLLNLSDLRHNAVPYDKIKAEHFIPAIKVAIESGKANIEKLKNLEPSFENTIEGLEFADDQVTYVQGVFSSLYYAHCTDDIQAISEEFQSLLTKYYNGISLDAVLFEKVKAVKEKTNIESLDVEGQMLLTKMYKSFVRNGAELNSTDKETIAKIDEEMSSLDIKFSDNIRKHTAAFIHFVDNKDELKGLPEGALEAAATLAKEKGQEGKWAFTLQAPSFVPVLESCENRELRKLIQQARSSTAFGGEFDNEANVRRMLELKEQRAKLLGYTNHSEFILEEQMAKTPATVFSFLKEIGDKAKPVAIKEFEELKRIKKEQTGDDSFFNYDNSFYAQALKKQELNFDDEAVRPYLKLENVISGVFDIAERLFEISFKEVSDLPTFHDDVKTFEVYTNDGSFIGLFYCDFHPRKEKGPGAWMNDVVPGGMMFGKQGHPHIHNTCNFTKPTESKPSLLTLNEVETLFHEFGHGLHGLLTKCKYKSQAGTNVLRDFVELPSQVMENWVKEKECLDLFAKHYETGEIIPQELVDKIVKASNFLEGNATLRQISFSMLDMNLHNTPIDEIKDLNKFENDILNDYFFYDLEGKGSMLCSFGHIFSHSGYSSGYYSYKWAEVLDADAFEAFKEKSIFDKDVAKKFKENILEKGGSVHPMELYKAFRGSEPSVDPLLKRAGLL